MAATRSHVSEKLAQRNGPRHSVYWVQCKPQGDRRAIPNYANVVDTKADMSEGSQKVQYTLMGKYTGDWKDGLKHGYGVLLYANGNKYEGEWAYGKRQGKGVYWVQEKRILHKQYAGDWHHDMRHGSGTFFHSNGGRFEGEWVNNKREGHGRMANGTDDSVYDGQWVDNERSGHGMLVLANGDKYDGCWLHDKKEGPGRFYYKATRKVYEGEWADGIPKCGTYCDNEDDTDQACGEEESNAFQLPELELAHPAHVVGESIAHIRQERVLEQVFQSHHGDGTVSEFGDDTSGYNAADDEELDHLTGVVFSDDALHEMQHAFHVLEEQNEASGCIPCSALPQLLEAMQMPIASADLLDFLDELGASQTTLVSFAECVDILSLLAESDYPRQQQQDDEHDDVAEEENARARK